MDPDFGELIYLSKQPHAGVLFLRMPGADRRQKVSVVQEIIERYGDQLPGHFAYTGKDGFAYVPDALTRGTAAIAVPLPWGSSLQFQRARIKAWG